MRNLRKLLETLLSLPNYTCEFAYRVSFIRRQANQGSLLYNKEKNKMKDCKITSGEDVSFTSRISQPLTNSSQALRTASSSSSSLCRSSHSKIAQNSLELGPFPL
ncbi:hypothetical protein HKD37_03G006868 [Glycine soja]